VDEIDRFTITVVLHLSRTFVSGKMMISWKNCDVINTFNCSTTSFYGKGYYYHSHMSWMNAGPQLSWMSLCSHKYNELTRVTPRHELVSGNLNIRGVYQGVNLCGGVRLVIRTTLEKTWKSNFVHTARSWNNLH